MPRDPQQLARALGPLVNQAGRRLGPRGVLALLVAAVLYFAVLRPLAERWFGLRLPTLAEASEPANPGPPATGDRGVAVPDPADLGDVLTPVGRDAYRSAAGLRYTRGSQHGTRLAHLAAHTRDDPDREGAHGVFEPGDLPTVIRLVDEAYKQALAGRKTRTEREGDQTTYTIDLGRRIGYVGGESGARRGHPPATHIRLVVQGDRFITAFPRRP